MRCALRVWPASASPSATHRIAWDGGVPPDLAVAPPEALEHQVLSVCRLLEPLGIRAKPGPMTVVPPIRQNSERRGHASPSDLVKLGS